MTSLKLTRRTLRRPGGRRGIPEPSPDGRAALGEKLRDAREQRGVDLYRVERDTKIRTKYLAALEAGDFSDLPGDVYTRGFLRNYATYLGLDADEIVEEWRQAAGDVQPVKPAIVGPQPLTMRRKVIFQQSHVVIAIVAIIVLLVASYFGYQLTRYLSYPTLTVAAAGPTPVVVGVGDTQYVLSGVATPNTTVLIAWNGQDPKVVVADDTGHWTFHAVLQIGSNQFDITAKNLDTSHSSKTVRLIVVVPAPTPTPLIPVLAFATPADSASFPTGSITVTGTSTGVTKVTLTPKYVGPPPTLGNAIPAPTPSSSPVVPTVPPMTMNTAADGTFAFAVTLKPGRWQLTVVGAAADGTRTPALARTITVTYKNLTVVIQVKGGPSWLKYFIDGAAVGQSTYPDGWSKTVVGSKSVCILASGKPSLVFVTVNGTPYGSVKSFGGIHLLVDKDGPRNVASC